MFEETRKIVENRLTGNWTETAIDKDNVKFTPVAGQPFIRLQIEWASALPVSVGKRVRGEGYILISIFTKKGGGSSESQKYADTLATLFNFYNEDALKIKAAVIQRIGQTKKWYQINLQIPFKYDSCFAPIVGYGGLSGYGN